MSDPFRSPKQTRVAAKSRSHPYARPSNVHRTRDVGVERSSSLLGALKNIVTAPLTWFSAGGHPQGSDDTPQKRRVSVAERAGTPPRPKRVRRESPQDGEEVGYLDPPSSLFVSKRPPIPPWDISNGITPARTRSLDPPSSAVDPTDLPLPPSRGTSVMTRTSMSIEPHDTILKPRSITRDSSMPPPSPFARSFSRSSFTPLAAGATFGPSPKRKTRESTAPPLLGPSPTPSFTRPPPAAAGHQTLFPGASSRGRSEDSIFAFLGKSRQSVSPMRESPSRSMLVGDESLVSRSPSIPKAERTLSTLESFRTPLQGPVFPSAPEDRRPRKVHVPNPSKLRFDHTPEGKKDKGKRVPEVVGPYSSGMSGMRKLLARRRDELQKEAEMKNEGKVLAQGGPQAPHAEGDVNGARKDQSIEMDADDNSEPHQSGVHVNGISSKKAAALPSSPPRSKADSYSSLRAPSNRVHRSHASAPKLQKPKNKFSLDDDEEEEEWGMSVEELKNYQAVTETRISFSPSRSMSEAGMQTDTSADDAARNRAVSPILPAQPQSFDSLLSRIGSSIGTTSKPVAEFPVEPPKAESDAKPQGRSTPTSESSTAPATLPFSLSMSSVPTSAPKPAEGILSPFAAPSPASAAVPSPALPSPVTGDGEIPSFFSNTKMQFTPPKVPSGFGAPLPNGDSEMGTERPSSLSGAEPASGKEEKKEQQQPSESKPSPFGDTSKPSVFGGSTASPLGTSTLPSTASATSATDVSSPFSKPPDGPEAPKSAFSFGTPSTNGAQAPISIFGAASKAASSQVPTTSDASTKPPFSFGPSATSTSTPSVDKPKETTSTAPSTEQSSKPLFSFGAPTSETPKSVFGFGTASETSDKDAAPSPFSFGAAPSTPPPAEKKPGFTFGVTNAFTSATGATAGDGTSTTPAAPKSVFGGFGSVGTSAAPSTPKPSQAMVENGDGMEVAADQMEESPTRTVEKKDTAAIQPPQTSAFAGFGTSTGSGGGFSFGQSKATPAESTYSLGQSKLPLSSGFSFKQSTDTSTTSTNTSIAFGFGTNSTKATGPPSSVFGAPLTSAFGGGTSNPAPSSSFSFTNTSTSSNANPFGQSQQQQENSATTAPSSPSLFPQATQSPSPSFSFSLPAPAGAFGAPKPDAATAAPSTPSAQPFQFGTSSSSQQPQSHAGATAANNMFTLGGAATPPRRVKGLPTRRGKRP